MTLPMLLGIGALGGLGAIVRLVVKELITVRHPTAFPLGTFVVNVSGAFAVGLLVGAVPGQDLLRLAGTGFLGAYTTFSTWAFESHRLAEEGRRSLAALNFLASLAAGLLAVWIGRGL